MLRCSTDSLCKLGDATAPSGKLMHPWIMALSANLVLTSAAIAQSAPVAAHTGAADDDPIRPLVARLDLAAYKSTIKGLTQFGDRRQGTERNRAAVDWIEGQ